MSEPLKAVEADANASEDGVLVPLVTDAGEFEILVPPAGKWKTRATSALQAGNFAGWVDAVLSDEGADTWEDADPTIDEANDFFRAYGEKSGESVSKSRASRRSSGSTRRR